ncbi:metalloprotease [Stagonosporopsis vannaccii]|nr:metalloprotease [Stagonosporopsis vannaccii]
MRYPFFLASLGLLASAADPKPSDSAGKNFDCGTGTQSADQSYLETIQQLHDGKAKGSLAARAAELAARDDPVKIQAVFHIVMTEAAKDSITNAMPQAQLDSLNESYNPYNIQFELQNVTWNTNDAWAVGSGDDDANMKKSLRQGTYQTLNIYFQTDLAGGVLGRCTLPSALGPNGKDPATFSNDGCNVNANTMPDGLMYGFNKGKTAVHETGHWLGLLHTFEGKSCEGPGDYIDDTPVESTATDGCPTDPKKQSCPAQQKPGEFDPIHNYMDYSIDDCYEAFSDLQVARMKSMWGMFRNGN